MEEIEKELYKTIESLQYFYDPRIIKYLNSLVSLKKSVLQEDFLKRNELELLASSGLYRKIIKYNLYNGLIKCYKEKASRNNILDLLKIEEIPCDDYSASSMGIYIRRRDESDYYHLLSFDRSKDVDFRPDRINITLNNEIPSIRNRDLYREFTSHFKDRMDIYDIDFNETVSEESKDMVRTLSRDYEKTNIHLKINEYE